MPSVPQSLLWISLVVLWLFVLVPMLISKREAVRRTSDVALATRVLNSGLGSRLKKSGPAAGHNSDPDWQPVDEDDEDELDEDDEPAVVMKAAPAEPEIIDVDVVEEETAPAEPQPEPEPVASDQVDEDDDGTADEYETVEDTSGLESEDDPPTTITPPVARRRLYESTTAAAVTARKYRFRKRVLSVMALTMLATTVAAVTVWHDGWWACGSAGIITILYLAYLRRQTRIEARVRRRRMQRMARSQLGVENTADREYDVPSRLRRPGAAVLEIDDEDPIFEHLEYAPGPMEYHLPRAAGQ
ncbi:MAG TPA: gephyrin-like molybdotransferase receptor GlpR [Mycobacterium sp.]|nr:gephyrin-like molybdotransferase receptor GlpR [Mycobacterium sp.]